MVSRENHVEQAATAKKMYFSNWLTGEMVGWSMLNSLVACFVRTKFYRAKKK